MTSDFIFAVIENMDKNSKSKNRMLPMASAIMACVYSSELLAAAAAPAAAPTFQQFNAALMAAGLTPSQDQALAHAFNSSGGNYQTVRRAIVDQGLDGNQTGVIMQVFVPNAQQAQFWLRAQVLPGEEPDQMPVVMFDHDITGGAATYVDLTAPRGPAYRRNAVFLEGMEAQAVSIAGGGSALVPSGGALQGVLQGAGAGAGAGAVAVIAPTFPPYASEFIAANFGKKLSPLDYLRVKEVIGKVIMGNDNQSQDAMDRCVDVLTDVVFGFNVKNHTNLDQKDIEFSLRWLVHAIRQDAKVVRSNDFAIPSVGLTKNTRYVLPGAPAAAPVPGAPAAAGGTIPIKFVHPEFKHLATVALFPRANNIPGGATPGVAAAANAKDAADVVIAAHAAAGAGAAAAVLNGASIPWTAGVKEKFVACIWLADLMLSWYIEMRCDVRGRQYYIDDQRKPVLLWGDFFAISGIIRQDRLGEMFSRACEKVDLNVTPATVQEGVASNFFKYFSGRGLDPQNLDDQKFEKTINKFVIALKGDREGYEVSGKQDGYSCPLLLRFSYEELPPLFLLKNAFYGMGELIYRGMCWAKGKEPALNGHPQHSRNPSQTSPRQTSNPPQTSPSQTNPSQTSSSQSNLGYAPRPLPIGTMRVGHNTPGDMERQKKMRASSRNQPLKSK
ncbi:MAG: hypothetical protein LBB05_04575 [Puniceicoccales bacterium]|nr:hypothetical protein [Puniceicoccales bacterium]